MHEDGSRLATIGFQRGDLEKTAKDVTEEAIETIEGYVEGCGPGVQCFQVRALGPAPDYRESGSHPIRTRVDPYAKALLADDAIQVRGAAPIMPQADPVTHQVMRVVADHSTAYAKLLVGALMKSTETQNTIIERLQTHNEKLEAASLETLEALRTLILSKHERKMERAKAERNEGRKDRLVNVLLDDGLPVLLEQLSGAGPLMRLIDRMGGEKLSKFVEFLDEDERELVFQVINQGKKRHAKAAARKEARTAPPKRETPEPTPEPKKSNGSATH